MKYNTGFGDLSTSRAGIPVYPGSFPYKNGGFHMKLDFARVYFP
jgi:hypothetical protein